MEILLTLLSLAVFANPAPLVDEAGWLETDRARLEKDLQDLEQGGGIPMRIWITPSETQDPEGALAQWIAAREEPSDALVGLGVFPATHRIAWFVGPERRSDLVPSFLDRVLAEIVNPALRKGNRGEALLGAVGAVALKSGYSITRWSQPTSPSGASVLALLVLGLGIVALGTYGAVSLFRMGAAGGILLIMYLSFGWFAYQEWFIWMGALGCFWAVVLLVLSRFTSIRLPIHPASPEPTRAPASESETENRFPGGRAASHW